MSLKEYKPVLLIFVGLWPAERKKHAEEAAAVPAGG